MGWEAWFTLLVLVVVLIALVREWGPTDMVLMAGAVAVTVAGIITPKELFAGFSNEGMLTVAALFVVASALATFAYDRPRRLHHTRRHEHQSGSERSNGARRYRASCVRE